MKPLHDEVFDHLRDVSDWPELEGTRYEATQRIGRGGMGAVYSATDRLLNREVALKVLNVELRDTEASERLAREAKILAALEHPGIVPVHDLGSLPDGRMFYVMKLVHGERLDEYIKGTKLLSELLQVFLKICDAVGFAHAKGIVHRDLKPQNVMIGSYGEVLVLDWGIAGFLASLLANPNGSARGFGTRRNPGNARRHGDRHSGLHAPGTGARRPVPGLGAKRCFFARWDSLLSFDRISPFFHLFRG